MVFFNFPKTFNIKYKIEGNMFVNINRNYFFKTCIFYFFNSLENLKKHEKDCFPNFLI